jgi:RNA polymerase sigma-70 factor, ECF subfamily
VSGGPLVEGHGASTRPGFLARSASAHSHTPSDKVLLTAFVDGDQDAFDQLVDRHARRVYAICLRYFGNPADAEDAAQEAFLTLYRRAGTFTGAARFSTWMYRVATNVCNDLARKRGRRPQAANQNVADLALNPAADLLANRELGMDLEAALAALDPEYRELILLHDVGGFGYADIAVHLGVPVGTVKSRIHRGHARLAATLRHLRREPAGPVVPQTYEGARNQGTPGTAEGTPPEQQDPTI